MKLLPSYLITAIFAIAMLPTVKAHNPRSFRCPPYLKQGDTVAIVSPAAKVRRDNIQQAFDEIESWGLHVKIEPHACDTTYIYFSGTDEDRASDLQAAIDDPSVKAIIACQGGYGSVRILPMLNLKALKKSPKWIVGFSDITMLHLAVHKLSIQSIHGTMPALFDLSDESEDVSAESLRKALFGEPQQYFIEPDPMNRPGSATGILAGGNMTILASAAGTPEAVNNDQPAILLIEEVNESAYRLDRMMQQLLRSGALDNVTAIVAGHFTKISGEDRFDDYHNIIRYYADKLGVPLMFGFPAGHEAPNMSVYLGRSAKVEVTDDNAMLTFGD